MNIEPLRELLGWCLIINVAILLLIFGWLLPQIIDYEVIWQALTSLTWQDLANYSGGSVRGRSSATTGTAWRLSR